MTEPRDEVAELRHALDMVTMDRDRWAEEYEKAHGELHDLERRLVRATLDPKVSLDVPQVASRTLLTPSVVERSLRTLTSQGRAVKINDRWLSLPGRRECGVPLVRHACGGEHVKRG